jgi:hypothetical protein
VTYKEGFEVLTVRKGFGQDRTKAHFATPVPYLGQFPSPLRIYAISCVPEKLKTKQKHDDGTSTVSFLAFTFNACCGRQLTIEHLASPTDCTAVVPYVTLGPSGRCASYQNKKPGLSGDLGNFKG